MAAVETKKPRQLLQQAEKILLHPIHPHLIAYCPTMDLIAIVTDEENLDVYRISGQRAFGLKRKSEDVSIDALQWEFNGKSIAVSWSDGSTDLVNAETGKVSHKDLTLPTVVKDGDSMQEDDTPPRVKCMGWGLNFIDVEAVKRRTGAKARKTNGTTPTQNDAFGQPTTDDWDAFKDETTVEDFLQRQPDFQSLDIAPDLPDQLAMMDMETLLPKLPAIPPPPALPFMRIAQASSGTFSTQADVDALLHSHHLKDHNSVDMFIRCSDQGTIHPSIYDSTETVNIQLPKAWNLGCTPLLQTSHPYSPTHSLLMRTISPTQQSLSFVPLTLNFIPAAGIYLHLIASKTSQLQNLLQYITQTLSRMRTFFKHAQDLPGKFMANISDTLQDKGQGDLVTNLFHIACTGNCPPVMREWLVDELAEAGHKRWDNTVTSSLATLLALLHENFIPALDRCSIIISRLRGLAEFHDREWIFSSPLSDFTSLLEVLKNMRLLAHTALQYAGEEKRQFHAFSKWLRFVIDYEATELDSTSRGEMEARDAGVDVGLVMEYIQFGMRGSSLTGILGPGDDGMDMRDAASYADTKKAMEVGRDGGVFRPEAMCLECVLGHFGKGVHGLLRQVSKWQEGNVRMDSGVVLDELVGDDEPVVDMRMVYESSTDTTPTYITHARTSSPTLLHIHRIDPNSSYASTTLTFLPTTKILDAKFADDTYILVLLSLSTSDYRIIRLPYTSQTSNTIISYHPTQPALLPTDTPTSRPSIPITSEQIEKSTRHVFEGRFTPLKLVVNGRKGRRVVVVLGSDRRHYRVLDMDYRKGGEGSGTGSEDEGEGKEGDVEGDVEMEEG